MQPDKRIEWLCANVPAFEPAYLQAEKARQDTEENRKRMAEHMSTTALRRNLEASS